MSYYNTLLTTLHFLGMAAWFGTALSISIIWSKKEIKNIPLTLELMTKIEMPASFFMPLTGVLMMIESPDLLASGLLQLKITISSLAIIFTHLSRAKLIHGDMKNEYVSQKFSLFRNLSLLALLVIVIFVSYK